VFVGSTTPVTIGGTSAVAPLWAGLTALLVGALGHAVGDLNTKLYPLIGTTALRDITSGTNGGFSAKAGWDAVTGCGTPVGQELLAQLEKTANLLFKDGEVLRGLGSPDQWERIGKDSRIVSMAAASGNALYLLFKDGEVLRWLGSPDQWERIGNDSRIVSMAAASGNAL
jgi:hypothetical protein